MKNTRHRQVLRSATQPIVKGKDGKSLGYSYTKPNENGKSDESSATVPKGVNPVASAHTHGKYDGLPGNGDNKFSDSRTSGGKPGDVDTYKAFKVDGYVATPDGSLQKYDVKTDKVTVLNTNQASDPRDPGRKNFTNPDGSFDKKAFEKAINFILPFNHAVSTSLSAVGAF